jgi:hypothetical protein
MEFILYEKTGSVEILNLMQIISTTFYVIHYEFKLNFLYLITKLSYPGCFFELPFHYRECYICHISLIVFNFIKDQM